MRPLAKGLLLFNGLMLVVVVLWLLVGGGQRGYYGGGAAAEVDGILLMFLALFNVGYLATVFFSLPHPAAGRVDAVKQEVLGAPGTTESVEVRAFLRTATNYALAINGLLVLGVGLWLTVSTGRWSYFRANATEVDMILLFALLLMNLVFMAAARIQFSRPAAPPPGPA